MASARKGEWSGLNARSKNIKVGVVVHGPAAVYSGEAQRIISFLKTFACPEAVAGGTMSRAAVLDMGLDCFIDINKCEPPSIALNSFEGADALVLINHGKDTEAGVAFGEIVASRLKDNFKDLIHIERASEKNGEVIIWKISKNDNKSFPVASLLAKELGISLRQLKPDRYFAVEIKGEKRRIIKGTKKGEPLFINGIFVGYISDDKVFLTCRDNVITRLEGVKIKEHGLSKIKIMDIDSAMIKSGWLRDRVDKPLIACIKDGMGKASIIDHGAFKSFDLTSDDTVCAITIGDDTTEIACDVLARLGIRTIGITDGDLDSLLSCAIKTEGSVIFKVSGITDDDAGIEVCKALESSEDTFEGFVEKVKGCLDGRKISYTMTKY
jgi:hypothetical protein